MSPMPRLLSLLLWVILGLSTPLAQAELYSFGPPPATADRADERPQTEAIDPLLINNRTRLPAFRLSLPSGAEDGMRRFDPDSLTLNNRPSPKHADQLAAFYHAYGWLLVPKGWQAVQGGVGANGSESLLFRPPSGPGYLSFYHTSACVGCAQSTAAVFFPEARKDAQANEFLSYTGTRTPLHTSRIRPHMMAYRTTVDGQQIDGVAYYNAAEDLPFFKVEVSLPANQRHLASPILNWFVPPKTSKQ